MHGSFYDLNQLINHDGQSDTIDAKLPNGAFVFPAMFVAHLGRGSSGAGHEFLDSLVPESKGAFETHPVKLARDEHVFLPDQVAHFGGGDIKDGGRLLEKWVKALLGEEVGYPVDRK